MKIRLILRECGLNGQKRVLHLFNSEYVHKGDFFTHDDYLMFKQSEYIRSASDYDDFYIAKKEDCAEQVENARRILRKIKKYIQNIGV